MKTLICFGLFLIILGCRDLLNLPRTSLVRLQNNSNYDLKIVTFGDFGIDPKSPYYIRNGLYDSLHISKKQYLEKIIQPRHSFQPYLSVEADSIVIIFDSKRILKQSCNGIPLSSPTLNNCSIINNLLDKANGLEEEFKKGKYERRVTYKITQGDYDRAVDIVK